MWNRLILRVVGGELVAKGSHAGQTEERDAKLQEPSSSAMRPGASTVKSQLSRIHRHTMMPPHCRALIAMRDWVRGERGSGAARTCREVVES